MSLPGVGIDRHTIPLADITIAHGQYTLHAVLSSPMPFVTQPAWEVSRVSDEQIDTAKTAALGTGAERSEQSATRLDKIR